MLQIGLLLFQIQKIVNTSNEHIRELLNGNNQAIIVMIQTTIQVISQVIQVGEGQATQPTTSIGYGNDGNPSPIGLRR